LLRKSNSKVGFDNLIKRKGSSEWGSRCAWSKVGKGQNCGSAKSEKKKRKGKN